MEPVEAILMAEKSLRQLIRTEMKDRWQSAGGAPSREKILERRAGEAKLRTGVYLADDDLDYFYIREIQAVYEQAWRVFEPIFPQRQQFRELIGLLVKYRNPPAHGRQLLPFEKDLVRGAAGYIENHITLYRSNKDDAGSHYPVVLSVVDNFGVLLNSYGVSPYSFASGSFTTRGPRLDVGQEVIFTCDGSDPRQRELIWTLWKGHLGIAGGILLDEQLGNPARLSWTTTLDDVSEDVNITVRVTSKSQWKRHPAEYQAKAWDDERMLRYAVRPPLNENF